MYRNVLLLALVGMMALVAAQPTLAQRGARLSPEELQERLTAQLDETISGLALEGDRAETVRAILLAQAKKQSDLRRSAFQDRGQGQGETTGQRQGRQGMQAFREKAAMLRDETVAMLAEVLSEEELQKYQEIVASRQRQGRRQRGA